MVHNLKKYLHKKIKIFLKDERYFTGKLLKFDNEMNLILNETIEFRKFKKRNVINERKLGLCFFRGCNIVNVEKIEL